MSDGAETNTGIFAGPTDTGTNPLEADTSGDGLPDGDVVSAGYNPNTSYTALFNLIRTKGVATQEGIGLFSESAMMSDTLHEHHHRALAWFLGSPRPAWSTCAITENGFVRILGHRNYPNFDGGPEIARDVLRALCLLPGHQYWDRAVTVRDAGRFPHLPESKHLIDAYLLALAVHHRGCLATLDRGLDASLVRGGEHAVTLIP